MSSQHSFSKSFSIADLRSGFLVFLIALPLSLGIALASGVPPIAGIITAAIGGLLATWFGSAPLTIKGPAAGMIVICLGAVQELGQGDALMGYRRALAVGVVAAVLQIGISLARGAIVGLALSPSVVHGMLAAIGIIIMSKQAHVALGVVPSGHEPLELLAEIPKSIAHANPEVVLIGLGSLALLFGSPLLKNKKLKAIPPQLWVLGFAVPLGLYFDIDHGHDYRMFAQSFHVGPEFLVQLPASLSDAFTFPDFSAVTSATSIKYIIMYTLVGSIESVLSAVAVDSLDPRRRASNLNKDLFATGVGNLVAAGLGGLPMISEIVRSKANIDSGAQSRLSNFWHGAFLALAVALIPGLLHQIPLAALAAMLIFTGSRLAAPSEAKHALHIGRDQLLLFATTLVLTLATDLLIGVATGLALEFALHLSRGATLKGLFGAEVSTVSTESRSVIRVRGQATALCVLKVRRALIALPEGTVKVTLDLSDVTLVDHTFLARVRSMGDELPGEGLMISGIERLKPVSEHPDATRKWEAA